MLTLALSLFYSYFTVKMILNIKRKVFLRTMFRQFKIIDIVLVIFSLINVVKQIELLEKQWSFVEEFNVGVVFLDYQSVMSLYRDCQQFYQIAGFLLIFKLTLSLFNKFERILKVILCNMTQLMYFTLFIFSIFLLCFSLIFQSLFSDRRSEFKDFPHSLSQTVLLSLSMGNLTDFTGSTVFQIIFIFEFFLLKNIFISFFCVYFIELFRNIQLKLNFKIKKSPDIQSYFPY